MVMEWSETTKFLEGIEKVTLKEEPRLLRANLLDFVKSKDDSKPREMTALTRRMEQSTKSYSLALKFREQEIKLKKMGAEGAGINIQSVEDFIGISQTPALLDQEKGLRKEDDGKPGG